MLSCSSLMQQPAPATRVQHNSPEQPCAAAMQTPCASTVLFTLPGSAHVKTGPAAIGIATQGELSTTARRHKHCRPAAPVAAHCHLSWRHTGSSKHWVMVHNTAQNPAQCCPSSCSHTAPAACSQQLCARCCLAQHICVSSRGQLTAPWPVPCPGWSAQPPAWRRQTPCPSCAGQSPGPQPEQGTQQGTATRRQ